jgi:hypothetical protein
MVLVLHAVRRKKAQGDRQTTSRQRENSRGKANMCIFATFHCECAKIKGTFVLGLRFDKNYYEILGPFSHALIRLVIQCSWSNVYSLPDFISLK